MILLASDWIKYWSLSYFCLAFFSCFGLILTPLPFCCCKKRTGVSFSCVCPVIDNEFLLNIVKVVCGSTRLSPRGSTATLTMFSLQCRRILAGRVDIYFHRMFRPPSWNRKTVESLGEVKRLPSVGGRKKNWREREKERSFSPQFSQSAANPKWRQNTRKIERWKPPKPPALQANNVMTSIC